MEKAWRFAVVTMSDKGSRGERLDESGAFLRQFLTQAGFTEAGYRLVPDRVEAIVEAVYAMIDLGADLVITSGGTGLAPSDVTPEAMDRVFQREVPGIAEMLRLESLKKTPMAALSRGRAGVRGESLIINLPGSLKAARENIAAALPILDHALAKIKGDPSDCGQG
ncbi:MAG: MogA/MoaB family molybdenum cofactor biosynthesis protein [Desulfobulbaceae bacterium]|jgi:molybdenum cofactor synthesis domain-containing protein|nr:MogA/MoaB family molybdenum cofactor biosynthesis protein [Desulfobulbaceae bacterium]